MMKIESRRRNNFIEMLPLLAVTVLLILLYWYSTATYNYWKRKHVFEVKPMPLLGNFWEMWLGQKSQIEINKQLYDQTKLHKIVGVYFLRSPVLLINDPEIIKHVLVKDFNYFPGRGIRYSEASSPLNSNLFFITGPLWKYLRVKLTPTFTSGKMKVMFSVINECADELLKCLEKEVSVNKIIDWKDVTGRYTTDVIASCAFGLQLGTVTHSDSDFKKMGNRVFRPTYKTMFKRIVNLLSPALYKFLRFHKQVEESHAFFLQEVKKIVAYRESNNIHRKDFLQLLIQLKHEGKVDVSAEERTEIAADMEYVNATSKGKCDNKENFELTDTLLAAQCFVFFIAGFETSSSVMSFCLYELALNPDIQQRLYQEIEETLQGCGGTFTYDAVKSMVYLDMVVAETIRKYPTLPQLSRICVKKYTIPGTGVTLDEGTRVLIPVSGIHHDPQFFPNPEKFDPERFNEENKLRRNKYTYLPFGDGPRVCIGMRFGQMQTKVGLAALLSKFEFSVCEKTQIPLKFNPKSFVPMAKDGIQLKVSQRQPT